MEICEVCGVFGYLEKRCVICQRKLCYTCIRAGCCGIKPARVTKRMKLTQIHDANKSEYFLRERLEID